MTAKEFFYLVAQMRETQKRYFKDRDKGTFLAARALENDVDREIRRVREILGERQKRKALRPLSESLSTIIQS